MTNFEFGPCDPAEYLDGKESRLRRPPELAASPQTQTWMDLHRYGASMHAARIHEVEAEDASAGLYVVRFTVFIDKEEEKGVDGHGLFEDGIYLHEIEEGEVLLIPRNFGESSTPIEAYFRKTEGSGVAAMAAVAGEATETAEAELALPQVADSIGVKPAPEPVLV